MSKLYCRIHEEQYLERVCVDSKCQKRSMLCQICARQYHMGHIILPFSEVQSFLKGDSQIRNLEKLQIKEENRYNGAMELLSHKIQEFIEEEKNKMNTLQKSLTGYIENKTQKQKHEIQLNQDIILSIIKSEPNSDNLLEEMLQDEQIFKLDDKYIIKQFHSKSLNQLEKNIMQSSTELFSVIQSTNEYFPKFESAFNEFVSVIPQIIEFQEINSCSEQIRTINAFQSSQRDQTQKQLTQNLQISEKSSSNIRNMLSEQSFKVKVSITNEESLKKLLSIIIEAQKLQSLWVDIPIPNTAILKRFTSILPCSIYLKKLFISFAKQQDLMTCDLSQLFKAISNLSKLSILSLKIKGCNIQQGYNWEDLIVSLILLRKQSIIKCFIQLDTDHKLAIQRKINQLQNPIDFLELIDCSK